MTDGRAITGMTADSHARSDIPAFFSPQEFQFFRIALSRFSKSSTDFRYVLCKGNRYLRDFQPLVCATMTLFLLTGMFTIRSTFFASFLQFSQLVFLATTVCLLVSFHLFHLYLFPSVFLHRLSGSLPNIARLEIRMCRSHRLYYTIVSNFNF